MLKITKLWRRHLPGVAVAKVAAKYVTEVQKEIHKISGGTNTNIYIFF